MEGSNIYKFPGRPPEDASSKGNNIPIEMRRAIHIGFYFGKPELFIEAEKNLSRVHPREADIMVWEVRKEYMKSSSISNSTLLSEGRIRLLRKLQRKTPPHHLRIVK